MTSISVISSKKAISKCQEDSAVFGLYLLAFFWTVLDNLLVVIFGKVHFIAVIMHNFFWELTGV
jgi:hypothetical protein